MSQPCHPHAPARRPAARAIWVGLALATGLACKRPETALRERPVQRVELVQKVAGMTSEEERATLTQLAEAFGIPVDPPVPGGLQPVRVFRLALEGRPNPSLGRGPWKTVWVSTGSGALIGVLLPAVAYTFWTTARSAALAVGTGGLLGLAYGPAWYKSNQALEKELGYLPWVFSAEWTVLDRGPGLAETVVARSGNPAWGFGRRTPMLNLRPHLKPLPADSRSEAGARQASLRAYVAALGERLRLKGPGRGESGRP